MRSRWHRYWFADGGRFAAAVVRITIAGAVLLTLSRLVHPTSTGDLPGTHALYRPVGIWMLLGHSPPPAFLVSVLWVVAWTATFAMLLGLASRAATAASFVAGVALASLAFASSARWSHQYNVVFLAQLAFLGARGGDALSLDAVIRHVRGLPAIERARAYQWSLRLVQLAVALMFVCAAFHKILHGHFTLRWATSDNLRNQLLVRFDLAGLPRTPAADWLIDDPWRYRTAALLNLVSQTMPIFACVFVRRPVVRALCGAFFVVETLALGFVVDLWNLQWLPLYAVFVDWDWLLRRRPITDNPPPAGAPPRAARSFVIAFVGYDLLLCLVPGLDQALNTYPVSAFPMFATVLANPPYGEHQPYTLAGDHFEVVSEPPIDLATQRWFDHSNRGVHELRDPTKLRARLTSILAQAQRRYPMFAITRLRVYETLFVAPPYPAPAHLEPHPIAIVGELAADGTFRTVVGAFDARHIEPHPHGIDLTGARLAYYRDDDLEPVAIDTPRSHSGRDLRLRGPARPDLSIEPVLAGDPIYVVLTTRDGDPWLVSSHADWKWR